MRKPIIVILLTTIDYIRHTAQDLYNITEKQLYKALQMAHALDRLGMHKLPLDVIKTCLTPCIASTFKLGIKDYSTKASVAKTSLE